jgi:tetratricopeptide (TPR) repeat protein
MGAGPSWKAGLAALLLGWCALPVQALPRFAERDPICVQPRGADVGAALLLEYYNALPEIEEGDDRAAAAARLGAALETFRKKVAARYTEGTLLRLLNASDNRARQAAVLALGMLGTMNAGAGLSGRLHDDDPLVRQLASDALWAVWFRGDTDDNNRELQRLTRLRDNAKALTGLDALIKRAPNFAEAYNQRAVRYFQMKEYEMSAADCDKVLQLNPYHFGAQSGLGQCYMNLRKPKAALKAFREAFRLNPNLDGIEETIRALENALGEEGKK